MRKSKKIKLISFVIATIIIISGFANTSSNNKSKDVTTTAKDAVSSILNPPNTTEETPVSENVVNNADTTVTFVDVGQGDGCIIESGDDVAVIDTGKYDEYDAMQNALDDANITEIDYIFLTHPDADHIGCADCIIDDYTVNQVIMPDVASDSKTYSYLSSAIAEHQTPVEHPNVLTEYAIGLAKITCLGPTEIVEETNSDSLILRLDSGTNSFLFLGDASGTEMTKVCDNLNNQGLGYLLQTSVVKLAHHGSAQDNANSPELIQMINPKYAVISCGFYNSYGHPHEEVMQLLKDNNISFFRTDEQGTVKAYVSSENISWSTDACVDYASGQ